MKQEPWIKLRETQDMECYEEIGCAVEKANLLFTYRSLGLLLVTQIKFCFLEKGEVIGKDVFLREYLINGIKRANPEFEKVIKILIKNLRYFLKGHFEICVQSPRNK